MLARGLLLVEVAMVFGDTSESVDEVISPRFLFLSFHEVWTVRIKFTLIKQFKEKDNMMRRFCALFTLFFVLLIPISAWADDLKRWDIFEADGITYMVANTNTLEVYVGPSQRIEGYDDNLFEGMEIEQFGAIPQEYVGDIMIPSSIIAVDGKSYTVTAISMNAFSGRKGITSVTIPNTVTTIQFSAFSDCI